MNMESSKSDLLYPRQESDDHLKIEVTDLYIASFICDCIATTLLNSNSFMFLNTIKARLKSRINSTILMDNVSNLTRI
jgi:hypothetical protein